MQLSRVLTTGLVVISAGTTWTPSSPIDTLDQGGEGSNGLPITISASNVDIAFDVVVNGQDELATPISDTITVEGNGSVQTAINFAQVTSIEIQDYAGEGVPAPELTVSTIDTNTPPLNPLGIEGFSPTVQTTGLLSGDATYPMAFPAYDEPLVALGLSKNVHAVVVAEPGATGTVVINWTEYNLTTQQTVISIDENYAEHRKEMGGTSGLLSIQSVELQGTTGQVTVNFEEIIANQTDESSSLVIADFTRSFATEDYLVEAESLEHSIDLGRHPEVFFKVGELEDIDGCYGITFDVNYNTENGGGSQNQSMQLNGNIDIAQLDNIGIANFSVTNIQTMGETPFNGNLGVIISYPESVTPSSYDSKAGQVIMNNANTTLCVIMEDTENDTLYRCLGWLDASGGVEVSEVILMALKNSGYNVSIPKSEVDSNPDLSIEDIFGE